MNIGDLLPAERIVVPLPGKTLHDAAEQLADVFVRTGVTADGPGLVERIGATPARNAVAAGGHAFILSLRSESVNEVAAALGVTADPIALEPESDKLARVVLVLVAPYAEASTFLQAVATFDRVLSDEAIVEPIAKAGSAEAVLAVADLFAEELPGQLRVADLMTRRPRSVWPDATLEEAARVMVANRINAIPVTSEQGAVVGLVTHRAILETVLPRYLKERSARTSRGDEEPEAERIDPRKIPVRDVMDRSVLCLSEEQTLADVANILTTKEIERIPVVRDGSLVGVLNRQDIVRRLFGP